jgi:hypothetical protein
MGIESTIVNLDDATRRRTDAIEAGWRYKVDTQGFVFVTNAKRAKDEVYTFDVTGRRYHVIDFDRLREKRIDAEKLFNLNRSNGFIFTYENGKSDRLAEKFEELFEKAGNNKDSSIAMMFDKMLVSCGLKHSEKWKKESERRLIRMQKRIAETRKIEAYDKILDNMREQFTPSENLQHALDKLRISESEKIRLLSSGYIIIDDGIAFEKRYPEYKEENSPIGMLTYNGWDTTAKSKLDLLIRSVFGLDKKNMIVYLQDENMKAGVTLEFKRLFDNSQYRDSRGHRAQFAIVLRQNGFKIAFSTKNLRRN